MRLIDADKLKKKLNKMFPYALTKDAENVFVSVMMELEEQSTAYDIENVVKQISELEDWDIAGDINAVDKLIAEYDVIDIVRKGGVE